MFALASGSAPCLIFASQAPPWKLGALAEKRKGKEDCCLNAACLEPVCIIQFSVRGLLPGNHTTWKFPTRFRATERVFVSLVSVLPACKPAVSTTLPSIRLGCEQLSLFLARSDTSRWAGRACCTLLASRDSRAISCAGFQRSLAAPHQ